MKINRLDAHDRLQHLTSNSFDIGKCCQNLIDQRPFGDHAFYIFAHKRQIGLDERASIFNQDFAESFINPSYVRKYQTLVDVPTDRLIWQPRLTKPKAQTNSMLFKGYPGTDLIKVIWMLPAEELWDQFTKDKLTENKTVCESIYSYLNARSVMEAPEDDDLPDSSIEAIYREISMTATKPKFEMI